MATTVQIDDDRMAIHKPTSDKLASLKLAFKKKHELNISNKEMVRRLVEKAKLKDIE